MHKNQKEIISFLNTVESSYLGEIYRNQSVSYYSNWKKYMSERMSKLVKQGYVIRLRPGVFAINKNRTIDNTTQPTIFNQLK